MQHGCSGCRHAQKESIGSDEPSFTRKSRPQRSRTGGTRRAVASARMRRVAFEPASAEEMKMQTMRAFVFGALVSSAPFGALGCDVEDVEDVGDIDPIEVDLEPAVGPQPPTPPIPPEVFDFDAILRFHGGANLTGATVSRELFATDQYESETVVTYPNLSGSMPSGARSIRLTCGKRGARVIVYARPNSLPQISDWWRTGEYGFLTCDPWKTTTWNVPSSWATGVRSAHAMVMPTSGPWNALGFSDVFPGIWNDQLDAELPGGAERDGDPILTYRGSSDIQIRQNLLLNHGVCFERSAYFTLRVRLDDRPPSTDGPGRTVVSVDVVETYVDQASWPEPWDCRGWMEDDLDDGADEAAAKLRESLPTIFPLTGACKQHYFFLPRNPGDVELLGVGATVPNGCQ
jgi:hypothetical protein